MQDEIKTAIAEVTAKAKGFGENIQKLEDRVNSDLAELEERIGGVEVKQNRRGSGGLHADERPSEHRAAFETWLRNPRSDTARQELAEIEQRAASGISGPTGGYAVPEEVAGPLLTQARDLNGLEPIVGRVELGGTRAILPLPNNNATSGFVGEADTRAPTGEPTMQGPEVFVSTQFCHVQATEEILMDTKFDVASWLQFTASASMAEDAEQSMVNGDGAQQFRGLFATAPEAAADGARTIGAYKYIPSGAADDLGSEVFDTLVTTVYDLKSAYRRNATWIMSSATAGAIRKVKDAEDRPMWADSMAQGQPARLLGYPVAIVESLDDIGTNALPIAFGDFRRGYIWAAHGGLRVTVDDNITTPGFVKYYLRRRVGGVVYDDYAVRVIKCAAS